LQAQVGWNKIPMYIQKDAVLTEDDISTAALVDNPDGSYDIQLTFTTHGKLVLMMETTMKQGRHLVIFAKFTPKGWKAPKGGDSASEDKPLPGQPRISAWLAAPVIPQNGFSDGSLRFKPEASHEEAERIVSGLRNMSKILHDMED